jgi:hypothetical protein
VRSARKGDGHFIPLGFDLSFPLDEMPVNLGGVALFKAPQLMVLMAWEMGGTLAPLTVKPSLSLVRRGSLGYPSSARTRSTVRTEISTPSSYMHPEEKTKVGRIDLTIRFEGRVYILEFKVVE